MSFFPTKLQRTLRRGFVRWHDIQTYVWSDALRTCCLKVASQGGSLARHALFTVANLVLNLFKFSSSALIFPLESYSFIISLRAAVTDTSTSQSARFDRSLKLFF
jgi:hypothetical protein